jgi:hypothetical protein
MQLAQPTKERRRSRRRIVRDAMFYAAAPAGLLTLIYVMTR